MHVNTTHNMEYIIIASVLLEYEQSIKYIQTIDMSSSDIFFL